MSAPAVDRRDPTLSDLIDRAADGGERLTLRRDGREVAAIVSIEDLDVLRRLEDEADLADARAALDEAAVTGTIPWERVKADLGL